MTDDSDNQPLPVTAWLDDSELPDPARQPTNRNRAALRNQFAANFPNLTGVELDVAISKLLRDRFLTAWVEHHPDDTGEDLIIRTAAGVASIGKLIGRRNCAIVAAALTEATAEPRGRNGAETFARLRTEPTRPNNGRRADRVVKTDHHTHLLIRRTARNTMRTAGLTLTNYGGSEKALTPGAILDELLAGVDRDTHPDQSVTTTTAAFLHALETTGVTFSNGHRSTP